MLEIVTPFEGLAVVTVTTTAPLPPSSVTLAIVEFDAGEPACRVTPTAVIVGGVLTEVTVSMNVASVVKPQLSVARIVIVCVPTGAAPLMETTPVVLLTEIVPV